MKLLSLTTLLAMGTLLVSHHANSNVLFSLENLERERASYLHLMTNSALSADERLRQSKQTYRRMVDMERMVLRDERITQSDAPMVKNAFSRYELTFLAHASAESQRIPYSHWLFTLNITSEVLGRSKIGGR
ncbi:hypothetical protein [Alteromonas sp. C1M14]|uniref:hypothetical protein n=1 Tax=Alteromonas sp. C1M14 TaxID=2841567 RepID=UPI001C0A2A5A|nr:hypothetical protein [Alteromonas sp. C1M14]MBU2978212.1 hypothetical protein [Alteromonas sp. C1M14]